MFYKVKILFDGYGYEFVIVDDEGFVRIKVLKLWVRNVYLRKVEGFYKLLVDIDVYEINVVICLRMVLEMIVRIREILGIWDLWVCLICYGVIVLSFEIF